jgi:hypothetical protein
LQTHLLPDRCIWIGAEVGNLDFVLSRYWQDASIQLELSANLRSLSNIPRQHANDMILLAQLNELAVSAHLNSISFALLSGKPPSKIQDSRQDK